ncbi:MAG: hypothetical protein ACPL7R_09565, partial [Anaerolineae bacterium]
MKRAAILAAVLIALAGAVALPAPSLPTLLPGSPSPATLPERLRLPVAMLRWTGIHPTPTPT